MEILGFRVGSCTSDDFGLLHPQLPFDLNRAFMNLLLLEDINININNHTNNKQGFILRENLRFNHSTRHHNCGDATQQDFKSFEARVFKIPEKEDYEFGSNKRGERKRMKGESGVVDWKLESVWEKGF